MYALNAANGELLWQFETGGDPSHAVPAVWDGVVYVNLNKTLYALNAATPTPEPTPAPAPAPTPTIAPTPTPSDYCQVVARSVLSPFMRPFLWLIALAYPDAACRFEG